MLKAYFAASGSLAISVNQPASSTRRLQNFKHIRTTPYNYENMKNNFLIRVKRMAILK
jgi:hypothetical protein